MAGRRSTRIVRRIALVVGLGLAIAATAALVLTEDPQLLRLAVIGALWAFLIAAFVVAGQRRPGVDADPAASPATEVALRPGHELMLQGELAERREFELRTEVRLRREIEAALVEDMAALRGDLTRLRHDILERWDGELRVERVAVRAESTRVSGFGATFHALQDEARRLHDEGRPLFEVESAQPQRDEPDTASTVEFSVVPPAPSLDEVVAQRKPAAPAYPSALANPTELAAPTEPLAGLPVRSEPAWSRHDPSNAEGHRRRARHIAEDEESSVDASALLRRLKAETEVPSAGTPAPRRRHYRGDDESNDVLIRVLGG